MRYIKTAIFSVGYLISVLLLFYFLACYFGYTDLVYSFDFKYFDSLHYGSIAKNGYSGFLVAFFPAFPALWHVIGTSELGVCLINSILFVISYSYLCYAYSFSRYQQIAFLTIPSIVFCFLPYSESLFFFFSTMAIAFLKKNWFVPFCIALFFCSITRPISFVFIPAIFLTFLLSNDSIITRITKTTLSSFSILFGLILVFWIQKIQIGKWFTFFTEQENGWGNKFQVPQFPLSSWAGDFIVLYDGLALWACLICGVAFMLLLINPNRNNTSLDTVRLLCLSITAGTGILILFTRGGYLFSLNRFVFTSPFFIISLKYLSELRLNKNNIILIGFSFLAFSLLLGSYLHIKGFIKYLLLSLWIALLLLSGLESNKFMQKIKYGCLAPMVITQIYFIYRVLSLQWIG